MKIFSVYNNKGGVGKTTTTKYFAKWLAAKGSRVLLIDLDPQTNLTSQFLVSNDTKEKNTTKLLLGTERINDLILQTNVERIDIVAADLSLLEANNTMMLEAMKKAPTTRLDRKMQALNGEYDYVLIDCPPTMDLLVSNALAASTDIIIPIKADSYSVDGITMLINKVEEIKLEFNNDLKIRKIFLNQYKKTNNHRNVFNLCKEFLADFSNKTVGDYIVVSEDTIAADSNQIEGHKIQEQYNNLFLEIVEV